MGPLKTGFVVFMGIYLCTVFVTVAVFYMDKYLLSYMIHLILLFFFTFRYKFEISFH